MGLAEAVKSVYSNYATFDSRSRRSEYWYFGLFFFLAYIAGTIVAKVLGLVSVELEGLVDILMVVFWLGSLVPSIAVSVRRMHDTDHSGWWLLCPIVPLIFALTDGTPGDNRFGASPKGLATSPVPPAPPAPPAPSA